MTERNPLVAAYYSALEEFSNLELATLNNSLTGFDRTNVGSYCYDRCLSYHMIHADGRFQNQEELRMAVNAELTRRLNDGTFDQALAPDQALKLRLDAGETVWLLNIHKTESSQYVQDNYHKDRVLFTDKPKATKHHGADDLEVMGMVGIYARKMET